MGQELVTVDDRQYDGEAMARLPTGQHRQFVIELMDLGITPEAAKEAAERVGFHPYSGYRLLRDKRIIAAINEEAETKFAVGALVGVKKLIEIASNDEHKDQFKAAKELAAINGFSPEQKITVKHISHDSKDLIKQIRDKAMRLGMDPRTLLDAAGIIDGEFTEVSE